MTSFDEWIGAGIPDHILDEAIDWITRLDSDAVSCLDRENFSKWLDQEPMHRWAFEELSEVWAKVNTLSDLKILTGRDNVVPFNKTPTAVPITKPLEGPKWWQAAACIALIVMGVVAAMFGGDNSEEWRTAKAEIREIHLVDGSRIELNAQSVLRVSIDSRERIIWLDEGEAVFSVKPDKRPFIVHMPGGNVMALGTVFAVELGENAAEVQVVRGRVAVTTSAAQLHLTEFDQGEDLFAAKDTTILVGGERLAVGTAIGRVEVVGERHIEQSLLWREGILSYHQQPLAYVLKDMNRNMKARIQVADRDLNAIRISGDFHVDDPDAFLDYLSHHHNVVVTEPRQNWILLRKPE